MTRKSSSLRKIKFLYGLCVGGEFMKKTSNWNILEIYVIMLTMIKIGSYSPSLIILGYSLFDEDWCWKIQV